MDDIDKSIVRYSVITITEAVKGGDDYWIVDQKVVQKRQLMGKDLETKELSMSAKDKSLSRANAMATASILIYLESVNGDLFNENNEDGLISVENGEYIQ